MFHVIFCQVLVYDTGEAAKMTKRGKGRVGGKKYHFNCDILFQ